MKASDMTVEQFKEIRLKLGISCTELAAKLGISASCVYYYEAGRQKIPFVVGEYMKGLQIK